MKANRVHQFGAPDVIRFEEVEMPTAGEHEVLVKVRASGVGPWDSWVRSGKSAIQHALPLTLGSDLSGTVVEPDSAGSYAKHEEVFGVTNGQFVGANAEYAIASVSMIARRPVGMSAIEGASLPVVGVTAWQMLFDYAHVRPGQTVLVLGAGGNVGACVVQIARQHGVHVIATTRDDDLEYVRTLVPDETTDVEGALTIAGASPVDAVIDTVGGDVQSRSFAALKPGGALVSAVSIPNADMAQAARARATFFLVDVTTTRLEHIGAMVSAGTLRPRVGVVLPLAAARVAHEMLEGSRPRPGGKIVLSSGD